MQSEYGNAQTSARTDSRAVQPARKIALFLPRVPVVARARRAAALGCGQYPQVTVRAMSTAGRRDSESPAPRSDSESADSMPAFCHGHGARHGLAKLMPVTVAAGRSN